MRLVLFLDRPIGIRGTMIAIAGYKASVDTPAGWSIAGARIMHPHRIVSVRRATIRPRVVAPSAMPCRGEFHVAFQQS